MFVFVLLLFGLVRSEIGDVCGVPGRDCPQLSCFCGLCSDGITQFGCCDNCVTSCIYFSKMNQF